MKKSCIQIIILLTLILCGSFFQSTMLKKIHTTADDKLDAVVMNLSGENYRSAQTSYSEFKDSWHRSKKLMALVLSHDMIESVDRHSARLRASLNNEGQSEGLAAASELREIISELDSKFRINLQNIL